MNKLKEVVKKIIKFTKDNKLLTIGIVVIVVAVVAFILMKNGIARLIATIFGAGFTVLGLNKTLEAIKKKKEKHNEEISSYDRDDILDHINGKKRNDND
jgi:uncharacterized membrane protein YqgA involved in biofilm formation